MSKKYTKQRYKRKKQQGKGYLGQDKWSRWFTQSLVFPLGLKREEYLNGCFWLKMVVRKENYAMRKLAVPK